MLLVSRQFFSIAHSITRTSATCPIAESTCLDPTHPVPDEDDAQRSRVFALLEDKKAAGILRSLRVLGRNLPGKDCNQIVIQDELNQRLRLTKYHSERLNQAISNASNLEKLM